MVSEPVREHLDAALMAAPGDDLVDAVATGLGSATALIPMIRDEKSY
jgi:hypothetical protein